MITLPTVQPPKQPGLPDVPIYRTPEGGLVFGKENARRRGLLVDDVALQRARVNAMQMARQDMQQPNAMGGRAPERFSEPSPLVPQLEGESPAAYYMRSKAIERMIASDMRQPNAMGGPAQPSDATTAGLKLGNGVGDNNRERSFLERLSQSGLLSVLQGMPRAERMYGVGPLAAFTESALDVQAARSAAEQKQREMGLELAKERIKAQPKPPKPSAEITKLYDRMRANQNSLNFLNKIKQYMDKGVVTGGANAALNSIVNFAALFNINLGKTEGQKVDTLVKRLRAQLIASKAFGREANKQEIKLIEKIIPDAGVFTNIDQLREAYALLQKQAEGDARQISGLLENVYGLPSYSQAVPDNIPAFTRPNRR
jgi:hypothetical protein|tara:strand:+ start:120 stop:1232 length:1113 start_codon:yes stop_codon:yes gene_type:complete